MTPYLLVCFWRENVAERSTKCAARTPTPNWHFSLQKRTNKYSVTKNIYIFKILYFEIFLSPFFGALGALAPIFESPQLLPRLYSTFPSNATHTPPWKNTHGKVESPRLNITPYLLLVCVCVCVRARACACVLDGWTLLYIFFFPDYDELSGKTLKHVSWQDTLSCLHCTVFSSWQERWIGTQHNNLRFVKTTHAGVATLLQLHRDRGCAE